MSIKQSKMVNEPLSLLPARAAGRLLFIVVALAIIAILASGCAGTGQGIKREKSPVQRGTSLSPNISSRKSGYKIHKPRLIEQPSDYKILSIKELVRQADVVARVDILFSKPVFYRYKDHQYTQVAVLKVLELLKGKPGNKALMVYARDYNNPVDNEAAYELFDEVLVFLKRDGKHYYTLNDGYGLIPIYDEHIINWREVADEGLYTDITITYEDARSYILNLTKNN